MCTRAHFSLLVREIAVNNNSTTKISNLIKKVPLAIKSKFQKINQEVQMSKKVKFFHFIKALIIFQDCNIKKFRSSLRLEKI